MFKRWFKRPVPPRGGGGGALAKKAAVTALVLGIGAVASGCGGGGNGSDNDRSSGTILYSIDRRIGGIGTQIYATAPNANAAPRRLTTPIVSASSTDPVGTNQDASFSPDAKRVTFVSSRKETAGHDAVYVMNADGSEQQAVTLQTNDLYDDPSFHPNGRQIVCKAFNNAVGHEIRLASLDDLSVRTLVPASKDRFLWDPVFSPDGQTLAYQEVRPLTGETASSLDNVAIMLANADGTGATRLTTGGSPEFSPDGQQIVFDALDETYATNVYLINRDGTGRQLLFARARNPQFSPDGRRIAYTAVSDQERIHIANRDGSQDTALPNTERATLDDWR